jgi:hypothetical protein
MTVDGETEMVGLAMISRQVAPLPASVTVTVSAVFGAVIVSVAEVAELMIWLVITPSLIVNGEPLNDVPTPVIVTVLPVVFL